MRTLDTATQAYLTNNAHSGIVARVLIWVTARERGTNTPVSLGLWTGEDDYQFTVDGEARDYYGAGAAISIDPIVRSVGMAVQMQAIRVGILNAAAEELIRGYEPRLASVEVHRAFMDPTSGALAAGPMLEFQGTLQEVDIQTAAAGGEATCTLRVAGQARALNMPLEFFRSNAARTKVWPGDDVLKYATVSGRHGQDDQWGRRDPGRS